MAVDTFTKTTRTHDPVVEFVEEEIERVEETTEAPTFLRGVGRRALLLLAGAVFVGVAIAAFPGLDSVQDKLENASPGWVVVAFLFEVASVLAYCAAFRPAFCRKLPWGLSYNVAMAEQAANVLVPTGGAGGLALGAWALGRAGMSGERIARRSVAFFIITSAANFATAIIAGFGLAIGVFHGDIALGLAIVPALMAVAVGVLVYVGIPQLTKRVPDPERVEGRWRRRAAGAAGALGDGVHDSVALLRSGNPLILLGALGYMGFDLLAMWAVFEALGAPPAGAAFVLAYVLGQLGGLIPLPGGVGGTDGGLVGALVAYGSPASTAAAAVIGYRVFQLGLPTILGGIALTRLKNDPGPVAADC